MDYGRATSAESKREIAAMLWQQAEAFKCNDSREILAFIHGVDDRPTPTFCWLLQSLADV
jgi:hypothetical protein